MKQPDSDPAVQNAAAASGSLSAIAVGSGVAIGTAVRMPDAGVLWHEYHVAPEQAEAEIQKLYHAREAAQAAMEQELVRARAALQTQAEMVGCVAETAELLEAHALLLQDDALIAGAAQWVRVHHRNAAWALHSELLEVLRQYGEVAEGYLHERAEDIRQVVQWLLRYVQVSDAGHPAGANHMAHVAQQAFWERWQHCGSDAADSDSDIHHDHDHDRDDVSDDGLPPILVAHELTPADMLRLQRCAFQAFVTDSGSATAHVAIMGRSLGMPALVGAVEAAQRVNDGDVLVVDADEGVLWMNPDAQRLADYHSRQAQQRARARALQRYRDTEVLDRHGQRLHFYANIQQPDDAADALAAGMDGVGLFRTEYLFMNAVQLPDEEWQYAQYSRVLQAMQGRPVTIRTLDIGADKMLSADGYAEQVEPNPALGLRGLRWCRQNESILRTQLRALLRAGRHGCLRIMVPMLTNMEEAHYCRGLLRDVAQQLQQEGNGDGVTAEEVQLGAMVEVPAAALIADELLTVFDFLSIGTNDLVQYTLAADRGNQTVAALQDSLHPAVLWLIQHTVAAGRRCGKPVSVCGEMAGRTDCAEALLATGLQHFSMNAAQLLEMKAALAQRVQALQTV